MHAACGVSDCRQPVPSPPLLLLTGTITPLQPTGLAADLGNCTLRFWTLGRWGCICPTWSMLYQVTAKLFESRLRMYSALCFHPCSVYSIISVCRLCLFISPAPCCLSGVCAIILQVRMSAMQQLARPLADSPFGTYCGQIRTRRYMYVYTHIYT